MLISLETVEIGQMDGGNEDDRGLLESRMLADDLGQFESVDLRHADIHQHGGNVHLQQFLQRLLGGRRLDQVLPQFGEDRLVAEQFARLIIDHQDVHFFVDAHQSVCHSRGNVNRCVLCTLKCS